MLLHLKMLNFNNSANKEDADQVEEVGEHEVAEWRLPQNVCLQPGAQVAHLSPTKGDLKEV